MEGIGKGTCWICAALVKLTECIPETLMSCVVQKTQQISVLMKKTIKEQVACWYPGTLWQCKVVFKRKADKKLSVHKNMLFSQVYFFVGGAFFKQYYFAAQLSHTIYTAMCLIRQIQHTWVEDKNNMVCVTL